MHDATRQFILDQVGQYTTNVTRQDFTVTFSGTDYALTNVVAVMPSANGANQATLTGSGGTKRRQSTINRILVAAHWDTRPTADNDPNPANRLQPIPGANDGASGVAVLLEMARLLRATRPPVPVVLVFFDGEDFGQMFYGRSEERRVGKECRL